MKLTCAWKTFFFTSSVATPLSDLGAAEKFIMDSVEAEKIVGALS